MSLKMCLIIPWNVAGTLTNPNDITVYSNRPYRYLNAVFHSSPSLIRMSSVDHGSNRGGSPRFLGKAYHTPSNIFKLPQQLSIWLLITAQSDVYKRDVQLCVDSPPVLRFLIRPIMHASRG